MRSQSRRPRSNLALARTASSGSFPVRRRRLRSGMMLQDLNLFPSVLAHSHPACHIEASAALEKQHGNLKSWYECHICKQDFTGAMQLGLAEAAVERVQHLPEEDWNRLTQEGERAASLMRVAGRYAEAEAMLRNTIPLWKKYYGEEVLW